MSQSPFWSPFGPHFEMGKGALGAEVPIFPVFRPESSPFSLSQYPLSSFFFFLFFFLSIGKRNGEMGTVALGEGFRRFKTGTKRGQNGDPKVRVFGGS